MNKKNKSKKILPLIFSLLLVSFSAYAEEEIDSDINAEDDAIIENTIDKSDNTKSNTISTSPFSQARFVPDISVILDTSYMLRDKDNETFSSLNLPGFFSEAGHSHGVSKNGFNLNYGELALGASIDPFLDLFSVFHLTQNEFEIEEAFVTTRNLPYNLQIKAGRFLSSFGRMNPQHAHFWDFSTQPIIYRDLLGTHGIQENGIQFNWVAPTDFYLLTGLEILTGDNAKSFGTSGFSVGNNTLQEVNNANLGVAFIKSSFDIENLTVLAGLSSAFGGRRNVPESASSDVHVHSLSESKDYIAGGTSIYGADLTLRYFFDNLTNISWQSEYLYRRIDGSKYSTTLREKFLKENGGFYSHLTYRYNLWRVGARYELSNINNFTSDSGTDNNPKNGNRYGLMFEYVPSDFTRLRLEYNHDRSTFSGNELIPVNELMLSANFVIGTHGAHNF
jgi:hypothetical protein